MGTYDDLRIDGITWQTKALGKRMVSRGPGDEVVVERVASTDDPVDVEAYVYDDLPRRYLVQVQAVAYVLVEDGHLVGLATDDDYAELPLERFDYYGRDEHDDATHGTGIFEPQRPPRPMTPRRRPAGRPRRPRRPDTTG